MSWMSQLNQVAEPEEKRRQPEPHKQAKEDRKPSERNGKLSDSSAESTQQHVYPDSTRLSDHD